MKYIDLHTHTNLSDGKKSPEELVREAKKKRLRAIAVTDHDTVEGVDRAIKQGKKVGVEVIPGIEITAGYKYFFRKKVVHIVGLFIDHKNKELKKFIIETSKNRIDHKKQVIKELQRIGIKVTFAEVRRYAKGAIASPHIVEVVMKNNPGIVKDKQEFYDRIFPRLRINGKLTSMKDAVSAIKKSGGVAILAHPAFAKKTAIKQFRRAGGDGIEVYYPYEYSSKYCDLGKKELTLLKKKYEKLAEKYDLAKSGGSDYHGKEGNAPLGYGKLDYSIVKELKKLSY